MGPSVGLNYLLGKAKRLAELSPALLLSALPAAERRPAAAGFGSGSGSGSGFGSGSGSGSTPPHTHKPTNMKQSSTSSSSDASQTSGISEEPSSSSSSMSRQVGDSHYIKTSTRRISSDAGNPRSSYDMDKDKDG
jgi:hypothetical protein